jgi:MFS family permease
VTLLAGAAVLLALFVGVESRQRAPLVPFSIFRLRTLRASNVVGLLIGMSLFSMFFLLSLYMQQVLGWDALKSGLAYLPLALTIMASAGIASQLVTRLGFKPVLIAGMLFVTAGLVWFSQVSVDGSYVSDLLFPMLLAAVGLGFSFVPVTLGAVAGTEPHEAGLASGLINTSQQVGGALGVAILATIAFADVGAGRPDPAALTAGFQDAFLVGAAFALVGAILAVVAIPTADSKAMRGAEAAPVAA